MRSLHIYLIVIIASAFTLYPNILSAQEVLYGSIGNGSPVNPGAIIQISQQNGAGVFIGDPTTSGGINGIDFDSMGKLYGSVIQNGESTLIEINPITGSLINTIGPIMDNTGAPLSIGDLATQPGTDVLFAISSNNVSPGGILYTINKSNAVATFVGTPIDRACGLAFGPNGTLYCWEGDGSGIHIVNPANGQVIGNLATTPDFEFIDAAAVRADGIIFGSCGASGCSEPNTPDTLLAFNPDTGLITAVGKTGQGNISDLAFTPGVISSNVPTISQWGLIATAAVLGFIGFMFMRRRKATA